MSGRGFAKGVSVEALERAGLDAKGRPLKAKKPATKKAPAAKKPPASKAAPKAKEAPKAKQESKLEREMAMAIRMAKLPKPTREVCLVEGRRFRCDFAWEEQKVVLEVEGGIWNGGRHTSPKGFTADCEKYNLLAIAGYKVLRVVDTQIRSGEAVEWLRRALEGSHG